MSGVTYKVGGVVRATVDVECDRVRPGDLGVVVRIKPDHAVYPLDVMFFLDPDQEEWPVTLEEVEPVETPDP